MTTVENGATSRETASPKRSTDPPTNPPGIATRPTSFRENPCSLPRISLDSAGSEALVEAVAALVLERLGEATAVSPYLSVGEAAEYLRCKPQRIYDLLSARRLSKLKDGSRVLLLRLELDRHVAGTLPPVAQRRTGSRVAA